MVTEGFDIESYDERQRKIKEYNKNNWLNADKDIDPVIRLRYYRSHGYTKEALKDAFHAVRFEAYKALNMLKDAKKDPAEYIRNFAYNF